MLTSNQPQVEVLVVDDDPVFRRILVHTFGKISNAKVVAAVGSLAEAKAILAKQTIRLVTLDVVMKNESGLDLIPWVTKNCPKCIVALLTAGQEKKASQSIDAVLLGAVALILKPSGVGAAERLSSELARIVNATRSADAANSADKPSTVQVYPETREIIAVGASTGGPPAFQNFLRHLPIGCKPPILLTQHIAEHHVDSLVAMLSGSCQRRIMAAEHGALLVPGHVFVAARGKHLLIDRVDGRLVIKQGDGPEENYCRPAVDPMFRSVAAVCGRQAVGVVMTGMGVDGANGAAELKRKGAPVVVQDKQSSVVWGMPGAVVERNAASFVVPGADIASLVAKLTRQN